RSFNRLSSAAAGFESGSRSSIPTNQSQGRKDVCHGTGGRNPAAAGEIWRYGWPAGVVRLQAGGAIIARAIEFRDSRERRTAVPSQLRQAADDLVPARTGRALAFRLWR